MVSDGKQFVTHYISKDGTLDHWEYIEEDTFGPDGIIYDCSDWRDPRIVYREELGEFWMFLAARAKDNHSQAGLILQVDEEMKEGYYLYLEPQMGRLVYRSWLRMSEDGGKTFPYDVELETPVRRTEDQRYRMEILTEGSAATAYVNGEAAMSFRMYDYQKRKLGLFSFGKAVFESIVMKKQESEEVVYD